MFTADSPSKAFSISIMGTDSIDSKNLNIRFFSKDQELKNCNVTNLQEEKTAKLICWHFRHQILLTESLFLQFHLQ